MAKFKIRLKLQGLELEVEGNRDDVPLITESVAQQVAGLLRPAANIVEGEIVSNGDGGYSEGESTETKPKKARKKRTQSLATSGGTKEDAVDWVNDPSKFGTPKQAWSTAEKSLWVLYVVLKTKDISELSAARIATTFNKHFPQAGVVHPPNVSRDLGKLKLKSPAQVSEDRSKSPSPWFLTDAGIQRAEKLIEESKFD
jgi:hypothetical protein